MLKNAKLPFKPPAYVYSEWYEHARARAHFITEVALVYDFIGNSYEDGGPYALAHCLDISDWCDQNCVGRVFSFPVFGIFEFEKLSDAVYTKLMWN